MKPTNYNLARIKPKLASEWHPYKNGDLTPYDVQPDSQENVWWMCSKGHEWKDKVIIRNIFLVCPRCKKREAVRPIIKKDKSLAALNPALTLEWHPTKNRKLTPKLVTPRSNRKVWWVCEKGHEWQTEVRSRAIPNSYRKGVSGCPFCSGKAASPQYCLSIFNSALASEWHPTKNKKLTPRDVTPGSEKQVWWRCKEGHEWQAKIRYRKKSPRCPLCKSAIKKDPLAKT